MHNLIGGFNVNTFLMILIVQKVNANAEFV